MAFFINTESLEDSGLILDKKIWE